VLWKASPQTQKKYSFFGMMKSEVLGLSYALVVAKHNASNTAINSGFSGVLNSAFMVRLQLKKRARLPNNILAA
ncbi:MAG: hypothetical protein ACRC12_03710, partial [Holosporales bacterium]